MPAIDSIAETLSPTRPIPFVESTCAICHASMAFLADKAEAACTQCGMTASEAASLDYSGKKQPDSDSEQAKSAGWYETSEEIEGNIIYLDLPNIQSSNIPPPPKVEPKKDGGMPFKKKAPSNTPKIVRERSGAMPDLSRR